MARDKPIQVGKDDFNEPVSFRSGGNQYARVSYGASYNVPAFATFGLTSLGHLSMIDENERVYLTMGEFDLELGPATTVHIKGMAIQQTAANGANDFYAHIFAFVDVDGNDQITMTTLGADFNGSISMYNSSRNLATEITGRGTVLLGGASDDNGDHKGATSAIVIKNGTVPSAQYADGAIIYSEGGALKAIGSGGTITTMAAAEPHCPTCGADFMVEFDNPSHGYLAMCTKCLADELGDRPWIIRGPSKRS